MLNEVKNAIAARPGGTRLVFLSDYDGTLAGFHEDPTIPRPTAETQALLCQLAERSDLSFGIVSGRRIADLRTRTQLPSRVYLAGLHGMEIEVGARRWQHPDLWRGARARARVERAPGRGPPSRAGPDPRRQARVGRRARPRRRAGGARSVRSRKPTPAPRSWVEPTASSAGSPATWSSSSFPTSPATRATPRDGSRTMWRRGVGRCRGSCSSETM